MANVSAMRRLDAFRGLVVKTPLKDNPLQSDPANTDTTQEDPTVDSLQTPTPYTDIMRARHPAAKLKRPRQFVQGQPKVQNTQ
jgi:hypothetical protein